MVSIQDLIPLELAAYRRTAVKARVFHALARHCSVIITSSRFTAERVRTRFGYPEARIVVAPLPVTLPAAGTPCDRCHVPDHLDAYVTSLIDLRTPDPRKRHPWLLGAAERLTEHGLPLVLVGAGTERLQAPGIVGLGRLCDSHLRQVLARSACFLYASAYEGQGLPPQEALAAGTPVVAFRNTSLPEMLDGGAMWLEEPASPERRIGSERPEDIEADQLAGAALTLLEDPARASKLVRDGREHVQGFTLERFATGLARAYELLAA